MESASVENGFLSNSKKRAAELKYERPILYLCNHCGNKFTKLALDIHHKSCFKTETCVCFVCKSSKNEVENLFLDYTNTNDSLRDQLRDLLIKSFKKDKPVSNEEISNHVAEETEIFSSCNNKKKIMPFLEFHKSFQDELNKECNTSLKTTIQNTDVTLLEDKPCCRKLFCSVCNVHVLWDNFGTHILKHCQNLNGNLKCPKCDDVKTSPTYFLLHFYSHISSHPTTCEDCYCRHPSCSHISDAPNTEHFDRENQDHRCYICLQFFTHFQSLVNHMRLHSKEMPYQCDLCQRTFRQVGNLQRHMTTHRGEKPHKCFYCNRSFADPATLRNHSRVHTGETPYTCPTCKRGFTQIGNLKRHMALHVQKETGATSLKMAASLRNKRSLSDLKEDRSLQSDIATSSEVLPETKNTTHVRGRRRNGNFQLFPCAKCGKKYAWKHDLQIHFRTHTGEKPYRCEVCDKHFAQSGAVRIHKIRHHTTTTYGRSRWKKKSS